MYRHPPPPPLPQVRYIPTNDIMVLKINKSKMNGAKKMKEVELLKRLSHPNILQWVLLRFAGQWDSRGLDICVHVLTSAPLSCVVLLGIYSMVYWIAEFESLSFHVLPPSFPFLQSYRIPLKPHFPSIPAMWVPVFERGSSTL